MTKRAEYEIQKSFFAWISRAPALNAVCFHIPNGEKRDFRTAMKLKYMGVKPGVPDVYLAIPSKNKHGLFLEFKAGKGKVSENQAQFIENVTKLDYEVKIVYSLIDAQVAVRNYIGDED